MQITPIDLTEIVAVVLSMLVVLIPIAGLTARFAIKPLAESLANVMQARDAHETQQITERRVALLEQQVEALENLTRRLQEERAFDRELKAGSTERTLPAAGAGEATPG